MQADQLIYNTAALTMTTTTTSVISSANDLLASHTVLISRIRVAQQQRRRQLHAIHSPPEDLLRLPLIPSPPSSPVHSSPSPPPSPIFGSKQRQPRPDLPPAKRARVARYANYVAEEETIRNDYSQQYVDGGEWPQNWVLGAELEHRFEE
jgi:mRNA (2'-O-methyladenosine-N6-)-methyltransferase